MFHLATLKVRLLHLAPPAQPPTRQPLPTAAWQQSNSPPNTNTNTNTTATNPHSQPTLSASLRCEVRSTILGLARNGTRSISESRLALPTAPPPPCVARMQGWGETGERFLSGFWGGSAHRPAAALRAETLKLFLEHRGFGVGVKRV